MLRITYAADNVMNLRFKKVEGFTLLEILLVLVIASSLVVLMLNYSTQKADQMRRDKATLQVQQILNSALSFYLNNSFWPVSGATISNLACDSSTWTDVSQGQLPPNYIPKTFKQNPYGKTIYTNCSNPSNGGGFYVYSTVSSVVNAQIIAGNLPMAFITDTSGVNTIPPKQSSQCQPSSGQPPAACNIVVASVNIPGQNLNNARSVNFAGLYYSGSCVPAPNCPPGMKADIIVSVASAAGINDSPTCSGAGNQKPYDPAGCTGSIYPMSSVIAFARGGTLPVQNSNYPSNTIDPVSPSPGPLDCAVKSTPANVACLKTYLDPGTGGSSTSFSTSDNIKYWRVCLMVMTEKGLVTPASAPNPTQQGKMMGSIMAVTRCVPNNGNENPTGSFNVYQNNFNWNP